MPRPLRPASVDPAIRHVRPSAIAYGRSHDARLFVWRRLTAAAGDEAGISHDPHPLDGGFIPLKHFPCRPRPSAAWLRPGASPRPAGSRWRRSHRAPHRSPWPAAPASPPPASRPGSRKSAAEQAAATSNLKSPMVTASVPLEAASAGVCHASPRRSSRRSPNKRTSRRPGCRSGRLG